MIETGSIILMPLLMAGTAKPTYFHWLCVVVMVSICAFHAALFAWRWLKNPKLNSRVYKLVTKNLSAICRIASVIFARAIISITPSRRFHGISHHSATPFFLTDRMTCFANMQNAIRTRKAFTESIKRKKLLTIGTPSRLFDHRNPFFARHLPVAASESFLSFVFAYQATTRFRINIIMSALLSWSSHNHNANAMVM